MRGISVLLCLSLGFFPATTSAGAGPDDPREALPAEARLRLGSVRLRHGDTGLRSLAYSPDGKLVAVGDFRAVRLWDTASGAERGVFPVNVNMAPGYLLGFGSQGKTVATVDHHRRLRVWTVATGKELLDVEVAPARGTWGGCPFGAFAPDGKTVAVGFSEAADAVLYLCDLATGQRLWEIKNVQKADVAFSPDSRVLAVMDAEYRVRLWDMATGKERGQLPGTENRFGWLCFTADGKQLVLCGPYLDIYLYDLASAKERTLCEHMTPAVRHVEASCCPPDGKTLRVASSGRVRTIDLETGRIVQVHEGADWRMRGAAFSPDGKQLAIGREGFVRFVDLATGKERIPTTGHRGPVTSLTFAPDGSRLASSGEDGTIRLWDLATGREIRRWSEPADGVAFLPDGKRLLIQGRSFSLLSCEGAEVRQLEPKVVGRHFALSPDGRLLATTGMDQAIHLFDVASGKEQGRLPLREELHHNAAWGPLAFSPDDQRLLAGLGLRHDAILPGELKDVPLIYLWDVNNQKLLRTFGEGREHFVEYINALAFAPDGQRIAVLDSFHSLRLWNAENGRKLYDLGGRRIPDVAFAFSDDGHFLATVGDGSAVHLWETTTGQRVQTFHGHRGRVSVVAFAPRGKVLATAGVDSSVLVWDILRPLPMPAGADEKQLRQAWDTLAASDAEKAYRAMRLLSATTRETTVFLEARLRAAAQRFTAEQITRWITDLDDATFAKREKAAQGLAQAGRNAQSALVQTLKSNPPLEVRRRVEALLRDLDEQRPTPQQLQIERAIAVLERFETSEVRQALRRLAETNAGSEVAIAAQAAYRRLVRQEEILRSLNHP